MVCREAVLQVDALWEAVLQVDVLQVDVLWEAVLREAALREAVLQVVCREGGILVAYCLAGDNEVDASDCGAKAEWTEPNQHPLR